MGQEQVDLINLSLNGGNDVRGVMSPEIESSKAKQARWRVTVIRYKCVCVYVFVRERKRPQMARPTHRPFGLTDEMAKPRSM